MFRISQLAKEELHLPHYSIPKRLLRTLEMHLNLKKKVPQIFAALLLINKYKCLLQCQK